MDLKWAPHRMKKLKPKGLGHLPGIMQNVRSLDSQPQYLLIYTMEQSWYLLPKL